MGICTLILLTLLAGTVSADQLIMKNGDVITGTISEISDGDVYIEPSYADKFTVSLSEVASIQTDGILEIELKDGTDVEARFDGVDESGAQLAAVENSPPLKVDLDNLAEAVEPEEWYDRNSHADLNMTINDGNTDSQAVLVFADTRLKLGDHRHLADLTIRRDETNGVKTKKQLFRYEYNWMFNEPWYTGVTAAYERDPIRELDHRYSIGAIVGRDILDDSHRFLTVSAGLGFSEEKIAGNAESGGVAFWRLIYEHEFLGGDLEFFHNDTITYQLYDVNNTILKTNTGFRYDIIDDVYAAISLRYDYETDPAAGAENQDTTLAIGVGAEF